MHLNRHEIDSLALLKKSETQAKWQTKAFPGTPTPRGTETRPVKQALRVLLRCWHNCCNSHPAHCAVAISFCRHRTVRFFNVVKHPEPHFRKEMPLRREQAAQAGAGRLASKRALALPPAGGQHSASEETGGRLPTAREYRLLTPPFSSRWPVRASSQRQASPLSGSTTHALKSTPCGGLRIGLRGDRANRSQYSAGTSGLVPVRKRPAWSITRLPSSVEGRNRDGKALNRQTCRPLALPSPTFGVEPGHSLRGTSVVGAAGCETSRPQAESPFGDRDALAIRCLACRPFRTGE